MFEPKTLLSATKMNFLIARLEETKKIEAPIIEVGVYLGGTLLHMALSAQARNNRRVIGFDTFEGLPETTPYDECMGQHHMGDFKNEFSVMEMQQYFSKHGVEIRQARFPLHINDFPVSFAHLDVDLFRETGMGLYWLERNMLPGGIVVVDDYDWSRTPGVRKIVDEVLAHPKTPFVVHSHGQFQIALQHKGIT